MTQRILSTNFCIILALTGESSEAAFLSKLYCHQDFNLVLLESWMWLNSTVKMFIILVRLSLARRHSVAIDIYAYPQYQLPVMIRSLNPAKSMFQNLSAIYSGYCIVRQVPV